MQLFYTVFHRFYIRSGFSEKIIKRLQIRRWTPYLVLFRLIPRYREHILLLILPPNPAHKPMTRPRPLEVIAPQPAGDVHHLPMKYSPGTLRASIVREESSWCPRRRASLRQCDSLQCRWVYAPVGQCANQCLLVTHVELFSETSGICPSCCKRSTNRFGNEPPVCFSGSDSDVHYAAHSEGFEVHIR